MALVAAHAPHFLNTLGVGESCLHCAQQMVVVHDPPPDDDDPLGRLGLEAWALLTGRGSGGGEKSPPPLPEELAIVPFRPVERVVC